MNKTFRSWLNGKVISTLPIFVAVTLTAIVIWKLGVSPQAMPLILGMIAAGLVDIDDRFVGRLKNISVMLVVFACSTIFIQLSIVGHITFTLFFTLMGFVVMMFAAFGQRYSTMAFGALLVSVYTVLVYTATVPWYINPVLILIGAIVYSLSSLCIFFIFPNRAVQESVGDVFAALSHYFYAKAELLDPDNDSANLDEQNRQQLPFSIKNTQVIQAFNQCQAILFYRIRGQRRVQIMRMMKYYFAAQEIFELVSAGYFDFPKLAKKLQHTDLIFRIQRIIELQGRACADLAKSLQLNIEYHYDPRLERAINGLLLSLDFYKNSQTICQTDLSELQNLVESVQTIAWQLRHINIAQNSKTFSKNEALQPVQITGLKNMWAVLKDNFSFNSPLFRHAVRVSIVILVCCVVVETFQLALGYWILLTAILVCQPNHYATKLRFKQRIVGSMLGVLIGSLLPQIHPSLIFSLVVIVLTTTLFFLFRHNNYRYATFFITVQVLVSFYVMGFDIENVMFSRMLYTVVGAMIAYLASTYLWSDWKYFDLHKTVMQSLKVNAKYFLLIISQFQFGCCDSLKYRIARRQAQDKASQLGEMVNIMNSNPQKYASQLPFAFELLKLNYSLLSYISALGTYRQMVANLNQSAEFMATFYPQAKKLTKLLENLDSFKQVEFEQTMQSIRTKLNTFIANEQLASDDVKFLISQLNLIEQILPLLYAELKRMML